MEYGVALASSTKPPRDGETSNERMGRVCDSKTVPAVMESLRERAQPARARLEVDLA